MAVQAQYPSNIPFSDFRKRARADISNGVEDFVLQENVLQLCSSGLNLMPQTPLYASIVAEHEFACNLASARKKLREDEVLIPRQKLSFVPLAVDLERSNFAAPVMISPQTTTCSTGLQLPFENTIRLGPATTATRGRANASPSVSSILGDELQLQYLKHAVEIDEIIKAHGEWMKQSLEEKRGRHASALLALVDQCLLLRVREKEVAIEKVHCRNVELEDRVNQLSLESQIWQNVAWSNEAMVTSLRSNLEQVVAQSREQSKEGCGESDAKDVESRINGEPGVLVDGLHACTAKENKDLREQRNCRTCRNNSICVLLLPCRHLCLCKECDARLSSCPICGAPKNASVQVYMD